MLFALCSLLFGLARVDHDFRRFQLTKFDDSNRPLGFEDAEQCRTGEGGPKIHASRGRNQLTRTTRHRRRHRPSDHRLDSLHSRDSMAQSPSQRSPGQRQPLVAKKLASATTPGKASPSVTATAEPSVKKRQQGNLLDQELLALEKDGAKRHSRGFSEYLLEHSRKVEELQEKNRRLEEEVRLCASRERVATH